PFITRYRKERTGNLSEVAIREIQLRVGRLRELAERKETILKTIEAQGKLSDELAQAIRAADNAKRLEDLYLPYKPKKRTKASDAREKGLEPLALRIWDRDETLTDLNAAAAEFLNPEKELDTAEKVLEGVGHILAEAINELAAVRDAVRRVVWKTGKVVTTKAENVPEGEGLEYRDYFAYSEPVAHIPPHRVLAINRGDKENQLKFRLEIPRTELERALFSQLPVEGHPQADFLSHSALDALDRLLLPSLEREVRRDLTDMAERHAVDVFARNLRSLLLQPPIAKQVVLAIDPGFRTGCKVAVLDPNGNLLEHVVIHPHPPQNRRHEAKLKLKDLVGKHQVGVVAIGNGTACRETEELIAEIIAEGTEFHQQTTGAPTEPPVPSEAPPPPPDATATPPAPDATEAEAQGSMDAEPAPAAALDGSAPAQENGAPGSPETGEPVEALPPISGGAPEDGESQPGPAEAPTPAAPDGAGQPADPVETSGPDHGPAAEESRDVPPSDDHSGAPASTETVFPDTETGSATVDAPGDAPPPADGESPAEVPTATPHPVIAATEGTTVPISADAPPDGGTPAAGDAPPEAEGAAPPTPVTSGAEGPADATGSGPDGPAEPGAAVAPEAGAATSPPPGPRPHSPGLTGPPAGPKPKSEKHEQRPPRPKQPPPPPAPHPADVLLAQLAYVIVNEAGASVYSASPVGREEFPDHDATLRGTISIGRRLQDPLSELVKIEPQNIGVGLYQHDVNPKQLKETLDAVIESCVNFVGVDLNTASIPLLRHVSGLN
ncbi:MAG TPA: Tex-like N-terminal domain-containing protein, partial [Isosphaeraceae bacterium]